MNRLEEWHHNSIFIEALNKRSKPPSTAEEIMALGHPSNEDILERPGYVISYNCKRRVSNWVSECFTHDQGLKDNTIISRTIAKKLVYFEEDPDIDSSRRATLVDYSDWPKEECKNGQKKGKYERGHLAAAGNHGYNFKAYCNTFFLSNIVPMFPNVNKIIGRIENTARDTALSNGKAYTITGPYFHHNRAPNFVRAGSKVQVPDAIFKVIVYSIRNKPYKYVDAYFVENSPITKKTKITLADLKTITGLKFLSEVPAHLIKEDEKIIRPEEIMKYINPLAQLRESRNIGL